MKFTKQQQILGGVTIAGLIAVGVDHLIPHVNAADAAIVTNESGFPVKNTNPTATSAFKPVSLSERLRATESDISLTRGAFELGSVWQIHEPAAAVTVDPTTDIFASTHKLTETLSHGDRSGAIIDGKLCVVGQIVDGYKLISVTGRSAAFFNGRSRLTLNCAGR